MTNPRICDDYFAIAMASFSLRFSLSRMAHPSLEGLLGPLFVVFAGRVGGAGSTLAQSGNGPLFSCGLRYIQAAIYATSTRTLSAERPLSSKERGRWRPTSSDRGEGSGQVTWSTMFCSPGNGLARRRGHSGSSRHSPSTINR